MIADNWQLRHSLGEYIGGAMPRSNVLKYWGKCTVPSQFFFFSFRLERCHQTYAAIRTHTSRFPIKLCISCMKVWKVCKIGAQYCASIDSSNTYAKDENQIFQRIRRPPQMRSIKPNIIEYIYWPTYSTNSTTVCDRWHMCDVPCYATCCVQLVFTHNELLCEPKKKKTHFKCSSIVIIILIDWLDDPISANCLANIYVLSGLTFRAVI